MNFPLIAWVHSPIGFETYLAIRQYYPGEVHLILARNLVSVPEASVELPGGLYWNDSETQIRDAAINLRILVESIVETSKGYVLLVPQIAVPYIRLLVESEFCAGFIYYDEGSMSHKISSIERRSKPTHHQYQINWVHPLRNFADFLKVSIADFNSRQMRGVPLLNFHHEKYLGSVSFFDDAFPGLSHELLEICDFSPCVQKLIGEVLVVLLPPKNSRPHINPERFKNSLQTFFSLSSIDRRVVVKLHPNDRWNHWPELGLFEFDPYETLVGEVPEITNREVAFLPFYSYLTSPNSTSIFLQKMSKRNYIEVSR